MIHVGHNGGRVDIEDAVLLAGRAVGARRCFPRGCVLVEQQRVDQLQRRAATVGCTGPDALVVVGQSVDRVAEGVGQAHGLTTVGKIARIPVEDLRGAGNRPYRGVQEGSVLGDQDVLTSRDGATAREVEVDAVGQSPAGQIGCRESGVVELQELQALGVLPGTDRGIRRVVVDLVDHNLGQGLDVLPRVTRERVEGQILNRSRSEGNGHLVAGRTGHGKDIRSRAGAAHAGGGRAVDDQVPCRYTCHFLMEGQGDLRQAGSDERASSRDFHDYNRSGVEYAVPRTGRAVRGHGGLPGQRQHVVQAGVDQLERRTASVRFGRPGWAVPITVIHTVGFGAEDDAERDQLTAVRQSTGEPLVRRQIPGQDLQERRIHGHDGHFTRGEDRRIGELERHRAEIEQPARNVGRDRTRVEQLEELGIAVGVGRMVVNLIDHDVGIEPVRTTERIAVQVRDGTLGHVDRDRSRRRGSETAEVVRSCARAGDAGGDRTVDGEIARRDVLHRLGEGHRNRRQALDDGEPQGRLAQHDGALIVDAVLRSGCPVVDTGRTPGERRGVIEIGMNQLQRGPVAVRCGRPERRIIVRNSVDLDREIVGQDHGLAAVREVTCDPLMRCQETRNRL